MCSNRSLTACPAERKAIPIDLRERFKRLPRRRVRVGEQDLPWRDTNPLELWQKSILCVREHHALPLPQPKKLGRRGIHRP